MNVLGIFLNNEVRTGGHIRCLEPMEGLGRKGHAVTVLLNRAFEYEPRDFSPVKLPAPYRRRQLLTGGTVQKVTRIANYRGLE